MAARITPQKIKIMPNAGFRFGLSRTINMLRRKPMGTEAEMNGVRELTFSILRANIYRKVPMRLANNAEAKVSPRLILLKRWPLQERVKTFTRLRITVAETTETKINVRDPIQVNGRFSQNLIQRPQEGDYNGQRYGRGPIVWFFLFWNK